MKKRRKQNLILTIIFIIIIITSVFLIYKDITTKDNVKVSKETNKNSLATVGLYVENKNTIKEIKSDEK